MAAATPFVLPRPGRSPALWQVHTEVVLRLENPRAVDIDHAVEAHAHMLDQLEAGDVEAYRAAVIAHYRPLLRVIESTGVEMAPAD
ncbi:hypothetical protein [Janibacter cremeus]|uniref:DNA-binding GntR family transcriptional regulator n=1 Tax=Janibacter cremeus TaxID=1285192 RepID=A0A852VUT9_9MICO|nr:hypothetical protein [Janibacter cremeus]NYF98044.1 DNA-binding GntR family transcriptional regulator [Janibacter cremeus]